MTPRSACGSAGSTPTPAPAGSSRWTPAPGSSRPGSAASSRPGTTPAAPRTATPPSATWTTSSPGTTDGRNRPGQRCRALRSLQPHQRNPRLDRPPRSTRIRFRQRRPAQAHHQTHHPHRPHLPLHRTTPAGHTAPPISQGSAGLPRAAPAPAPGQNSDTQPAQRSGRSLGITDCPRGLGVAAARDLTIAPAGAYCEALSSP